MKQQRVFRRSLIAAATALALFGPGMALADPEVEGNNELNEAQVLEPGPDGSVTVSAVLGTLNTLPVLDVDFYSFHATAGQKITIDIDGGMNGPKELDTTLYFFGPNGMLLPLEWGFNDDGLVMDSGSPAPYGGQDSRIEGYEVPVTGIYKVAVTDVSVSLNPDGSYDKSQLNINSSYTITISGLTPSATDPGPIGEPGPLPGPGTDPVVQTKIEIKAADLVRGSRHEIFVALLSSPEFEPRNVDVNSLTFALGNGTAGLKRCSKHGWRINRDNRRDLVCHFSTEVNVPAGEVDAVLKGKMKVTGTLFEGKGKVKVVDRHAGRRDRDRDDDRDGRRGRDRDDDRDGRRGRDRD